MSKVSDIKKVVLIGPESSGKSTLCEKLSVHYKAPMVKEFARTYLETNGSAYQHEDLLHIAKGQLQEEKDVIERFDLGLTSHSKPLLFLDTDLYVIKVWSELVFNKCDANILNALAENSNSLYLLCEPDIPWVEDPLRAYPDYAVRHFHYHHFKDALVNQHISWVNINGDFEARFTKAVEAVDGLFQ